MADIMNTGGSAPASPTGDTRADSVAPADSTPATSGDAPADSSADTAAEPKPKAKRPGGFQKRISELTQRLRQAEKRESDLLEIAKGRNGQPAATPKAPKLADFSTLDEYLEARDDYRDAVRAGKATPKESTPAETGKLSPEQEAAQIAYQEERETLIEDGEDKYEDFAEVVQNEDLEVTQVMGAYILESDNRIDLAYYLGNNPKEAKRISRLPTMRQIAELGRIEDKLSSRTLSTKKPPAVPAPITPLNPAKGGAGAVGNDMESHIKARRSGKSLKEIAG